MKAHAVPIRALSVAIYHNILWSKYKGVVFSSLSTLSDPSILTFSFVQIAETEGEQAALSPVDTRYHTYPYELLFKGQYGAVPTLKLVTRLTTHVARTKADLVILPGYHRVEYWAMLFACIVLGKRRAVFCDSTRFDKPRSFRKSILKRIFFRYCNAYFGYGRRSREYLIQHGAKPDVIFARCQAAALPIGFNAQQAFACERAEDIV
jgi:hypothetical protein